MDEKEKLYIYLRVSTKEQYDKDYSIPRQKDIGIKKAKELNYEPIFFEEKGASASEESFNNRPVLFELLKLVNAGEVQNMFVYDATRLSRNTITKAIISESLKKKGVILYTFSKYYDFDKEEDVLTYRILEAIESYETSLRKARFQLGYISGNKKGRYLKHMPPFGYDKDKNSYLVVNKNERDIFLKMVDLYINKGYGTNQIANWLNENNISTKSSKILQKGYTLKKGIGNRIRNIHKTKNQWNPGTINSMLKNTLYYGKRKFKVGKDEFELVDVPNPFINEVTFDKIETIRKSNSISKKKEDKYFYLLKDLMICGNCGNPLTGRTKINRSEFVYKCSSKRLKGSSCTSRGINIEKLNNIVWNAFKGSKFYHKQINRGIVIEMEDDSILDKRFKELNIENKSIEKEILKIKGFIKVAIKKILKHPTNEEIYQELIDENNEEIKLLNDNKIVCLKNIQVIKRQRINKHQVASELEDGLRIFVNSQKELEYLYPYDTKEKQSQIKNIINNSIEQVIVTYDKSKLSHHIEVVFKPMGIKHNFDDPKPFKFKDIKSTKLNIKQNEKVVRVEFLDLSGHKLVYDTHQMSNVFEEARQRSFAIRRNGFLPIIGDTKGEFKIKDLESKNIKLITDNPQKPYAIELTVNGNINLVEIRKESTKKINSIFLPPLNTQQHH